MMEIARTQERDRWAWVARGGDARARRVDMLLSTPQAQGRSEIAQFDARHRRPRRGAGQRVDVDAAVRVEDAEVNLHARKYRLSRCGNAGRRLG